MLKYIPLIMLVLAGCAEGTGGTQPAAGAGTGVTSGAEADLKFGIQKRDGSVWPRPRRDR